MKFSDGYAFPHPVLGIGDDIEGRAEVVPILNEDEDTMDYIVTLQYTLENTDLTDLIAQGKARLLCEVNCSGTLYRKAHLTADLTQIIRIPATHLRGEVRLLCLLISIAPIPEYKNSKAHADFEGYVFAIDPGEVLAFLGETFFIAGIRYRELKAVSSFMEIIPGHNEFGDFNILLDNPKIQIQLSKNDFLTYSKPLIAKGSEFASTFHSGIVLPALIHALYQLADPEKRELREMAWAKIIEFRLANDENLKNLQLNEDNILKIAQALLGMPLERLLKDILGRMTADSDD